MLEKYLDFEPRVAEGVYVAPTAVVIGRVTLGEYASVWPGAVLRGDINDIIIGAYANIQDLTVGHVEEDAPLTLGSYVTVGHAAVLHACTVGDGALIGMGAIVLNGASVGEGAVLGAGSILPPGKHIPAHTLALGSPARPLRELTAEEVAHNRRWAEEYARLAGRYRPAAE
jgi:carbonic anhydrase/acetyltransferase-like protein (isoleucine patch superfamily)